MSPAARSATTVLAVDLGSTSFKAGVFGPRQRLLGMAAAELRYDYGPSGEVELQTRTVDGAWREAVRGALRSAGVKAGKVGALAITSQAQTFTVTGPDGAPRMPFISWLDMRAHDTCARMKRDGVLSDVGRHTSFGELLAPLQVCQLVHLRKNQPRFVGPLDRVVLLPSYFVRQLTGREVVDDNLAAMSCLYSIPLRGWWTPALRRAGLAACQLPDVVRIGSIGGVTQTAARAWGVEAGLPVVLAGNDQTAGAYGAQLEEGSLLITLGTAQVAYTVCRRAPGSDRNLIRGPFPGDRFYRMAADLCGGNLVNWAKTVLSGCATDEAFFAAAARAQPGCRGLVFRIGLPEPNSQWEGIGLHHTSGDFARSVLEALTARMVGLVTHLVGRRPLGRVAVAGGGSRQPLWLHMLSDALKRNVRMTSADPLTGAARMASRAVSVSGALSRAGERP